MSKVDEIWWKLDGIGEMVKARLWRREGEGEMVIWWDYDGKIVMDMVDVDMVYVDMVDVDMVNQKFVVNFIYLGRLNQGSSRGPV